MLPSVLVIIEAAPVRHLITSTLAGAGFAPVAAANPAEAGKLLSQFVPDAAVVDVDDEGRIDPSALARVRELLHHVSSSVFLTSDCATLCGVDRAGCGTSLCMDKPFQPMVLVEAVSTVLKAAQSQTNESVRYGPLALNPRHRKAGVKFEGAMHDLALRPVEFRLLRFLMSRPDEIHSRDDLLRSIWGVGVAQQRTVDQTIRRVRRELERFALQGALQTVLGVGYRLALDDARR